MAPIVSPRPGDGMLSRPGIRACMTSINTPSRPWLALLLLLLGIAGCAALWVVVAMASGRVSSWPGADAALAASLDLRLAEVRPGAPRAACGAGASAACPGGDVWR